MLLQLGAAPGGQGPCGERAQLAGVLRAGLGGLGRDLRLQVGALQPLPGPLGQGGDGVGADLQLLGHRRGLHALDLGVPQHGLPALGQRAVGRGHPGGLALSHDDVVELLGSIQLGLVLRGAHAAGRHAVVDRQTADGGDQVAAHVLAGAAAAAQDAEDAGEGLGDQVLGVMHIAGVHARDVQRGRAVPLVERGVRALVAGASRIQQRLIGDRLILGGRGLLLRGLEVCGGDRCGGRTGIIGSRPRRLRARAGLRPVLRARLVPGGGLVARRLRLAVRRILVMGVHGAHSVLGRGRRLLQPWSSNGCIRQEAQSAPVCGRSRRGRRTASGPPGGDAAICT